MPSTPEARRARRASGTGTTAVPQNGTSGTARKPRRSRKPTQNQIATNIAGVLQLGNATACELVPSYRVDALQEYEIELLSKAVAGEVLANAVLLKWYQSFGTSITGPHTLMAAAVVAIALPRLARRKMVPAHLAMMGTNIAMGMASVSGESTNTADTAAVQDDAGAARSDNGDDGFREIRVGPGAPGLALVPADSPDEAGQHPVRD